MSVSGLLKIIIFLLLVLVFGSVVLWIGVSLLGVYAFVFAIAFACVAVGSAIAYIIQKKWHIRIKGFIALALSKLHESSVGRCIAPYAKSVMYACELFSVIYIFVIAAGPLNIGRGIPILCFWIFAASLIVLYTFKDDKNLFYGAMIDIAINLLSIVFFSVRSVGFIMPFVSQIVFYLLRLIIFVLIAYFARQRLRNCNTNDIVESGGEEKPVNKLISAAPFILVLLIVSISAASYAFSPQMRFNFALDRGDIAQALEVYAKMPDTGYRMTSTEKLKSVITDLVDEYINEGIDYENAVVSLKPMSDIDDLRANVTEAMTRINEMKASREAFDNAKKAEKSGDLIAAFTAYEKVISEDKNNYKVATDKIKQMAPKIKKLAFSEIKKDIEKGDFINAKRAVDKALITLPHDSELLSIQEYINPQAKSILLSRANEKITAGDFSGAKPIIAEALILFKDENSFLSLKTTVDNALRAEKVEKAKTEQLVMVEHAEVIVQHESLKALYPDVASILVRNLSDKVVKNFTVVYYGINKSNYLVEVKTKDSKTEELTKTVQIKGANIQPGDIYQEKSVELSPDLRIAGIGACIKSVDFADGTTWNNPYYEFWNDDVLSYASTSGAKSTSTQKNHADSPSSKSNNYSDSPSSKPNNYSDSSGSKSNKTKDTDSDFEKYLKENDPDSYDYYQELEEGWDNLR